MTDHLLLSIIIKFKRFITTLAFALWYFITDPKVRCHDLDLGDKFAGFSSQSKTDNIQRNFQDLVEKKITNKKYMETFLFCQEENIHLFVISYS